MADRQLLAAHPEGKQDPEPEPARWEPAAPGYRFPEYTTHFPWPGPAILVRFPDGITVEFRPGADYAPRNAKVYGQGIDIKGLRLDFDVYITPDGQPASILRPWKTGVAGVDGAEDVPQKYHDAAMALCKQRAREARSWLNTALRGPR